MTKIVRAFLNHFAGRKPEQIIAAPASPFALPSQPEMLRIAVTEAVEKLGLLHPEAIPSLIGIADTEFRENPRSLCTTYRKSGEQITNEEKKSLGIRANGFLSRTAYREITGKGLQDPLWAHEDTLLRATFTMFRYRELERRFEYEKIDAWDGNYKYDMLQLDCPVCAALDGTLTKAETAHLLPPPGCECVCANYGLRIEIDWIGHALRQEGLG